jgi:hypothetical protein
MTDITPPPELVEEWANDSVPMNANAIGRDWERAFAARAAQWGADQELEACCHYFARDLRESLALELRAARRSKPPTLKEQALEALSRLLDGAAHSMDTTEPAHYVRRALEALDD